jgi:hypothetical protein
MKKELKLEAEKYARRFEENEQSGYNGESLSIEDKMEMEAFIAGATSNSAKKYWYKEFEKQKLEFAIRQIRECKKGAFNTVENKIKELEQQLSEL